jgi:hypothetical protein
MNHPDDLGGSASPPLHEGDRASGRRRPPIETMSSKKKFLGKSGCSGAAPAFGREIRRQYEGENELERKR